jgi:hypothetical protein
LNAWLGGFESILKKMTSANFNWLLHTMLFMHTKMVIQRQLDKVDGIVDEVDEERESSGEDSS